MKSGADRDTLRNVWKKLPREGKSMWTSIGKGTTEKSVISKLMVVKMKAEEQSMMPEPKFNFMNKMMSM